MKAAVAADPAFPHRDQLLDADAVGAYLSSRLEWRKLTRAERVRTTYRAGDSLRVLHRFHVDGRVCDVAARAFRDGRSGRAFEKAIASSGTTNAGVVHGARFDAVFWLFPNDRRVPALRSLERVRELLSPQLPRSWVRSRLVSWAPENRATFACLDASGSLVAYAKVGPGSRSEYQLYTALATACEATDAPLRLPRALAFSSEHDTILIEPVPGRRLSFTPDDMRGMGRALAWLHALPVPGLPAFGRCAATSRAAAVDLVARALPHLRDDVEALAAALARREPHSESCGSLHGDVHPKNALVEHGAVGLIDVEEMARGPRAADLASLLARLVCARLLGLETPDRIRAAADALLDGYSAVAPLPAASDLRWHLAATMLVERAQRAVTRLNDAALQRLDLIVAQGMRALDGEGDVS